MLLNQWWPREKVIQIVNNENFNPHHCISGDGKMINSIAKIMDFNPHHCISGDLSEDASVQVLQISIHTTASVVTKRQPVVRAAKVISIHTTASVVTKMDRFSSLI